MLQADVRFRRDAFTLQVRTAIPDGVTGVFGPSGAGKTTFLHALAGLLPDTTGSIALNETWWLDTIGGLSLPPRRRRVGMLFQSNRLFPQRTVAGNLAFAEALAQGPPPLPRAELLRRLELTPLTDHYPAQLSGGEQRRVALARALLGNPAVLLLDEPLANLDAQRQQQVLAVLDTVRRRRRLPILLVSHYLEHLLAASDRILLLDRGAVIANDRYEELLDNAVALAALRGAGLCNRWPLQVHRHRPEAGLTLLRAAGGGPTVRVALQRNLPVGAPVTAILRSNDILLSLAPLNGVSLQNSLPGQIRRLIRKDDSVLVHLDAGLPAPLVAELTPEAADRLALAPGTAATAHFKARAAISHAPAAAD